MAQVSEGVRQLREIITDDAGSWEVAWQKNITPWERNDVPSGLKEVLASGVLQVQPGLGTALVPGCGSGRDAAFLAYELGLHSVGMDISARAIETANSLLDAAQATRALSRGSVRFTVDDFFQLKGETYDIVFDYRFFVAIPPALRSKWGEQMQALVKPGGYLITLIYPIDPPHDQGPPFHVLPEHYVDVLGSPTGWLKVYDKVPVPQRESDTGREKLVVWKRF